MCIFSYRIKNVSYSNVRIRFLCAFSELMRIFLSSVFFNAIIQNAHIIGGWKRSYSDKLNRNVHPSKRSFDYKFPDIFLYCEAIQ